jgi:hypothetical protein
MIFMNPFFRDQAISVLRKALSGLIPWLVATQLLDAEAAGQLVSIFAGLIVSAVWGFASGKFKREKQLTGQATGEPVSENEVEAIVKDGQAPSVLTQPDVVPKLRPKKHR